MSNATGPSGLIPAGQPPRADILGGAALIAIVTVAARVVGFGRVVVFARVVGPTCLGDVYTTANTIPNIVFDVVAGGALSGVVVPVIAGRIAAGEEQDTRQIVGALLTWTLALLVPVSILGALLAHPFMSLLVGSGDSGVSRCDRATQVALGARMLQVFAPQIVLYGLGVVLAGTLQARRRFLAPALAPLLSSVVVIATYLLFSQLAHSGDLSTHLQADTWLLSLGTTVGVLALAAPLAVPALRKAQVRPTFRFPPGVAGRVLRLAGAGAAVLASQQIATGVVLRLANADGSQGAVVAWNLGWTVFLLPWAVLAVPVATSAFPALSVSWHRGDTAAYRATTASTTRLVLLLMLFAAAVLAAAAAPGARVLIAGAPGGLAPAVLGRLLAVLAVGLPAFGVLAHLSRVRFARSDTRLPAAATSAGWLVAIVADVIAAPRVPGRWVPATLAGGADLGLWLAALTMLAVVGRDLGEGRRDLARTAVVGTPAALLGAVAGIGVALALPQIGALASIGTAALAGATGAAVTVAVVAVGDRQGLRAAMVRHHA